MLRWLPEFSKTWLVDLLVRLLLDALRAVQDLLLFQGLIFHPASVTSFKVVAVETQVLGDKAFFSL